MSVFSLRSSQPASLRPDRRALDAYKQSLDRRKKLAAQDQGNAEAQWDLVVSLVKTAPLTDDPAPLYRQALAIVEALERDGRLAPSRKFAIELLRSKLKEAEAAKP